ncbi:unnamed protein product [Umbelopsis ramanniana]
MTSKSRHQVHSAPGYIQQQRSQRAAAILERALNPDSILFEIPNISLDHVVVIDAIAKQLVEVTDRTNMMEYRHDNNNLHLEIVFQDEESSRKAIEKGVTIDGIISKGSHYVDSQKKEDYQKTGEPTIEIEVIVPETLQDESTLPADTTAIGTDSDEVEIQEPESKHTKEKGQMKPEEIIQSNKEAMAASTTTTKTNPSAQN